MEFIRQVGNQAEVNDGGIIRRLPFSGEGVAPQPGAKVNPGRDACSDGFHDVALTLTTTRPYIKEIKIC